MQASPSEEQNSKDFEIFKHNLNQAKSFTHEAAIASEKKDNFRAL